MSGGSGASGGLGAPGGLRASEHQRRVVLKVSGGFESVRVSGVGGVRGGFKSIGGGFKSVGGGYKISN